MSLILKSPIIVLNDDDLGIDIKSEAKLLREYYQDSYQEDNYLLQMQKSNFLKQKSIIHNSDLEVNELNQIAKNKLNSQDYLKYSYIKAYRKRLIAKFTLSEQNNSNLEIIRQPIEYFLQNPSSNINDFKLSTTKRYFKELNEELVTSNLKKLLQGAYFALDKSITRRVKFIEVIVHHTIVYAFDNCDNSNAPEGIHQDGTPYIVSAFVVDKVNASGGVSYLYQGAQHEKFLELNLKPGQGIFQPDLNTQLWHSVSPIKAIDKSKTAYRSTIGLDILPKF